MNILSVFPLDFQLFPTILGMHVSGMHEIKFVLICFSFSGSGHYPRTMKHKRLKEVINEI